MLKLFNIVRVEDIVTAGFTYEKHDIPARIAFAGTITYTLTDPSVEDHEIESILKGAIKGTML